MSIVNYLETLEDLSPAAMTVRAQTLPPDDEGELIYDQFFPRENVDSTDLDDITVLDWRPTADRREWNAPSRRIPLMTPTTRKLSIIPVECNFRVDEHEIQKLMEKRGGNYDQVLTIIGARIPDRVDTLAMANYRRIEVDAMQAWSLGTITQRSPEDSSKTYTVSFGFDSSRYTTELTAWNDAGVNAYAKLLLWIAAAEQKVGRIRGVMLRQATFDAILADAPNLPNSVTMTRSQLASRVSEDIGHPFEFFINENSVDIFNDGGTAYTRTDIWPVHIIAAVPAGMKVGRTAFAPVVRAMELVNQVGEAAGIDVNGMTVYYTAENEGKALKAACQCNPLPIPEESMLYVTDVGV